MSAPAPTYDTVIVGAGNAGVSLAARLRRDGVRDIALVDPSPVHRYRPMLNYAAGAAAPMHRYERPMRAVVPGGVRLLPHLATHVDPGARTVTLDSGATIGYRDLVLCPGLTPHWEAVDGLREAYVDGWAVSAHVPEYAGRACAALVRAREGAVVFSVPPEPASCGGTVLKALLLACAHWRRDRLLSRLEIHLVTPFRGVLGLRPTDDRLRAALEDHAVRIHERTRVSAVDRAARTVTLDGPDGPRTVEHVQTAYVPPHSRAPRFIADSGLAVGEATAVAAGGDLAPAHGAPGTWDEGYSTLVEVDPETLRHPRVDAVWGLGDAATVGTRPSGGALRAQVPVLAANLRAARGSGGARKYDGYTVLPVAVGDHRLLLAEHDRDGRPAPSVRGVDLTRPRRLTYAFDRYLQPQLYFRRLLRGRV